jgi:hypothetical protein
MAGQPVLGADLNRSESRYLLLAPERAESASGQLLSWAECPPHDCPCPESGPPNYGNSLARSRPRVRLARITLPGRHPQVRHDARDVRAVLEETF